jgi:aspartate/methionine/tyrosine aminotransferase
MSLLAQRIQSLGTENAFKLGVDIQRVLDRGMDVVKLNLGEPDFDSAPHINAVAAEQIMAGNSHYTDPQGILPFREAIARHVSQTRGIDVGPDRVVVTPGAKPAIGYTMQTYVDPGDEVVYPSPGFPIYESWVTYVGAVPRPLHLSEERGFAFTADDLAALVTDETKVVILNSPSNPTGGVLSEEDLRGIAEVIRERCRPDVRVYSDEVYEHILFDGERHHSIASLGGMDARTIVASGNSKGFAMTGWRLGWSVLPTAEEAAVFKQLNINLISCVPPFIQEAGRAAYESPETLDSTGAMVRAFQERRDWVVPALNEIDGVRCQMPKGAFYVFPNVAGACERLGILEAWEALPEAERGHVGPSTMLQMFLLYRYGVATMDRNSFGMIGAEGQHFLRLSIAASLERLREGVSRIGKAVEDRDGFRAFLEQERLWEPR